MTFSEFALRALNEIPPTFSLGTSKCFLSSFLRETASDNSDTADTRIFGSFKNYFVSLLASPKSAAWSLKPVDVFILVRIKIAKLRQMF